MPKCQGNPGVTEREKNAAAIEQLLLITNKRNQIYRDPTHSLENENIKQQRIPSRSEGNSIKDKKASWHSHYIPGPPESIDISTYQSVSPSKESYIHDNQNDGHHNTDSNARFFVRPQKFKITMSEDNEAEMKRWTDQSITSLPGNDVPKFTSKKINDKMGNQEAAIDLAKAPHLSCYLFNKLKKYHAIQTTEEDRWKIQNYKISEAEYIRDRQVNHYARMYENTLPLRRTRDHYFNLTEAQLGVDMRIPNVKFGEKKSSKGVAWVLENSHRQELSTNGQPVISRLLHGDYYDMPPPPKVTKTVKHNFIEENKRITRPTKASINKRRS